MRAIVCQRDFVNAIECQRDFVGAVSYPRDFATARQWEFVRRKSCQRDFVLVLGGLLLAAIMAHGAPLEGVAGAAGFANTAADGQTRTVDSVAPRVTLSSTAPDPTRVSPIPMTATFSEDVAGFTDTDIGVMYGTVRNFTAVSASRYTFDVAPADQEIMVLVNIAAGVCADAAENSNTASADLTRVFDSVPPAATLSSMAPDPTPASPIPVTATFSEAVTGFTDTDIGVMNGTVGNFAVVTASNYTFEVTPVGQGMVLMGIGVGRCADAAGNASMPSPLLTRNYTGAAATNAPSNPGATNAPPFPGTTNAPPSPTPTNAPPFPGTTNAPPNPGSTNTPPFPGTTNAPPSNPGETNALPPAGGLDAPPGVSASDGLYEEYVRVTWESVSSPDGGAVSYEVWRSPNPDMAPGVLLGETSGLVADDGGMGRGSRNYYVVRAKGAAATSAFSEPDAGWRRKGVRYDFDGDEKSDVWYYDEASGKWYLFQSGGSNRVAQFGYSGAVAVPEDYDGDGIADLAVYDTQDGAWYILGSATGLAARSWGWAGTVGAPGDYNGDGKAELGIYDERSGSWYAAGLDGEVTLWGTGWGGDGLTAVSGDYDGDGAADLAVYDETGGTWYVWSVDGRVLLWGANWGGPGAQPVPGDYDGDGVSELAVYAEAMGNWYIRKVNEEILLWNFNWGTSGFVPIPGDYDGDGVTDVVVYSRDPRGITWYLLQSTDGFRVMTTRD